jgi:protocatechuate 3,4-dioxygenase beta subunit
MKLCALGVCLQFSAISVGQNQTGAQTPVETSATPTKVAGTVVSSLTGAPLAQTRVSIADTRNRANMLWMVTNDSGRFEFDRIPPGKYSLVGAKRGFLNGAYEQHEQFSTAIVTGTELDTTQLVLRLTPMASIEGRVIDEAGDPVRQGQVTLYRENQEMGFGRIAPVSRGSTNDLGTFEFAPLPPGKYYAAVSARPWYAVHPVNLSEDPSGSALQPIDRSLDVAYPTTYSGGATEADGAVPIEVKGGDHTEIEIHISSVPSLRIVFHVPEGEDGRGFAPPSLEKRVFDGAEYNQSGETRCVGNGVCEMTGVPAGTYIVRMPHPGSQQTSFTTSEIDLRSDGQELDASKGEPEGSLKLTIQMPQQEGIPKAMRVMLLDKQNRNRTFQEVDASGQATVENLPAGKYSIVIYLPGKPYSVVRTFSEAGETAGHDVNLPAGGALAVTAVLAAGSADIEGFVKRGGKAASGVMVVLIPKESSTREELFRRDQSDSDGSFSLRSVIPGQYSLVAIEDAWGFDWSKPGQLAHYAQHGQTITVPEGVQTTIHLPEPIEVQPR